MSNQYTKGKIKPYVEGIPRVSLKGISHEQLEKHYENLEDFSATIKPGEGGSFTVPLSLDRINTGKGNRYYMLCNNCNKRVTYLLYVTSEKEGKRILNLGCRHCFNVNYMVQQTTRTENDYHLYKLRQIGKKLDPDFNKRAPMDLVYSCPPFKPKWMKQVTYDRYRAEFLKHQEAANNNWMTGAEKIIKMNDNYQKRHK